MKNIDEFFFVILMFASQILLWIIYQISFVRSLIKYKYSWWWLLLTTLFYFYPPLIYILQTNRENKIIKNQTDQGKIIVGKLKLKFAKACFIFYLASIDIICIKLL